MADPMRIRATSKTSDIVIAVLLWLQLLLGLATIPLSAQHLDGSMMVRLADWGQRIVTSAAVRSSFWKARAGSSRPTCSWA